MVQDPSNFTARPLPVASICPTPYFSNGRVQMQWPYPRSGSEGPYILLALIEEGSACCIPKELVMVLLMVQ